MCVRVCVDVNLHFKCDLSLSSGHGYLDLSDPSLSLTQTTYPPFSLPSTSPSPSLPHSIAPSRINEASLVISAASLSPRQSYTFQLTAESNGGRAAAQISVSPKPPPHSSTLNVRPAAGIALETVFSLSVSGVVDSDGDSPFLYRFGFTYNAVSSAEEVGGLNITWLSGIQIEGSLDTILPSGPPGSQNLTAILRVIDRHGGHADAVSPVSILPSTLTATAISQLLSRLMDDFLKDRDWEPLLPSLVSIATDIDSSSISSSSLRSEVLSLSLTVVRDYLAPTVSHYELASQLLLLLLNGGDLSDESFYLETAAALKQIVGWYRREGAVRQLSREPLVVSGANEPLQLLPSEERSYNNLISVATFRNLLHSWSNIAFSPSFPNSLTSSFAEAMQTLSFVGCQAMGYGESPLTVMSTDVELYVQKSIPIGWFNVSGHFIRFNLSLEDAYLQQACSGEYKTCFETCFQAALYSLDVFAEQVVSQLQIIQLTPSDENLIRSEIAGANPQAVELITDVLSISVSIPSQNGYLAVQNLDTPISLYLPQLSLLTTNHSIPLCLRRPVGGANGFTETQWRLQSISPAAVVTVEGMNHFLCRSNELGEFAVGLLPPPPPPSPSSSSPTPSPTSAVITSIPETTSVVATSTPYIESRTTTDSTNAAAIAVPLLLVLLVAAVAVAIFVVAIWWKKRKGKSVKVLPTSNAQEGPPSSGENANKVTLLRAGPLTPEESKVPMVIIQLLDSGERSVLGSLNVLPSIRLRELRYQIVDNFASFKNRPFYFLSRQLVDIEPASEQQQFVSLVYGQTEDKPIFLRKVETTSDLTRIHFCVCGNASQFECSSCSAQGYCSPECQAKDWSSKHQRECNRLGEKKHRLSVLRRQMTLSPIAEHPPSFSPPTVALSPVAERTTAAPADFRSLLQSQRSFQLPPLSSPLLTSITTTSSSTPKPVPAAVTTSHATATTLGSLASQPQPPSVLVETQKEERDGHGEGAGGELTKDNDRPFPRMPSRETAQTKLSPLFASPPKPLFTPARLPPLNRPPPHPSLRTPHTSHSSQLLFQRTNAQHLLSPRRPVPAVTTQLSIHSVGSEDLENSRSSWQHHRNGTGIRDSPRLDSEEYSSTDSEEEEEEEERTGSVPLSSHPPTLSPRVKMTAAPHRNAPSPSSSSSSTSSSSSSLAEGERLPGQPATPIPEQQEHRQD